MTQATNSHAACAALAGKNRTLNGGIDVHTKKNGPQNIFIYCDAKGEFRWRATATNGKIIADGAEGYKSASNAMRAARRFASRIHDHGIEIVAVG
jgi:uncharacterized protein YegP (UPF0339 family)